METDGDGGRTVLVVPCFNEAERFRKHAFLEHLQAHPGHDLILVDDGSRDGTAGVLRELSGDLPGRVEVLQLADNQGKAEAVRQGVCLAMGRPTTRYFGYWDADLATPLAEVPAFEALLDSRPTVVVAMGSRVQMLGRSIERSPVRHYIGRVFATCASLTLRLPVYDTQCGAKLFRNGPAVRGMFAEPFNSRWVFDVEWLARLLCCGVGPMSIHEVPLRSWRDIEGSKVGVLDLPRALLGLWRIRRRYGSGLRHARRASCGKTPFGVYAPAAGVQGQEPPLLESPNRYTVGQAAGGPTPVTPTETRSA